MEKMTPALGINLKDYDSNDILAGKKWRITEKIDGVRRLFFKRADNKVIAYSRTGKVDIWLEHMTTWLEQSYFPSNMIYDCELVDQESYFGNVDSFIMRTETNSKASQEYPDNKGDLIALCFDMFSPDGDMRTGAERTKLLMDLFFGNLITEPVILIPILGYIQGNDDETINKLMRIITARKGEGLMLMNMASPYIPGRSKDLVKVKRMEEVIGTIIDWELGRADSKIAGGVASLICKVDGCTVPVRVGTGLTNAMRYEFASNDILGKSIEIECFGKSKDVKGDISISMPVFKQFVVN